MSEPNDMHGDEELIGQWDVDKYVDHDIDDRLQRDAERSLEGSMSEQKTVVITPSAPTATPHRPLMDGKDDPRAAGLKKLREPFPPRLVGKLPKPTKAQTDAVKANFKAGIRCKICGTWHHPDVIHLDYIGHAALTDRLLDADPMWTWEPLAYGPDGLPLLAAMGGMWIRLTVCGVTRLGYGDAQGKTGGDAVKERIGDALRNAAMRFGAALELWHKGDLHGEDDGGEDGGDKKEKTFLDVITEALNVAKTTEDLKEIKAKISAQTIDQATKAQAIALYNARFKEISRPGPAP